MKTIPLVNVRALGRASVVAPRSVSFRPALGQNQVAVVDYQQALKHLEATEKNFQNLSFLMGEDKARQALDEARAAVEKAKTAVGA